MRKAVWVGHQDSGHAGMVLSVLRGGSWNNNSRNARVAERNRNNPNNRNNNIGFRVARDLWLIDLIIDNSNPQEPHPAYFPGDDLFTPFQRRCGLPIGNLTSQFWANVYLNRFDHFVKEQLRAPGYIRYVDDFVLFGSDKQQLNRFLMEINAYLATLRLLPHPSKTRIFCTCDGVPFLGFRMWPNHRTASKACSRRFQRHLGGQVDKVWAQSLPPDRLEAGLNSWRGHVRFGRSSRLEYKVFWALRMAGVNVLEHPNGSWRVLHYSPSIAPARPA